jgi:cell wall-associated NlpC family hydrolase
MNEHTNTLSRRAFLGTTAAVGAGLACSSGILSSPEKAFAVTAAEKQAEAEAALDKLTAMQEKLDYASSDYFTALSQQQEAQDKMDEAQSRIDEANGQILDLQDQLGTRARSMYRTGSLSFIDLLLGATTFKAFTSNWDLLNTMNQNDANMVQQTKDLRAEVTAQKEEYAAQEAVYAEKTRQAAEVKAQAESLVSEMQSTYDSLSAEVAELVEQERIAREEAEAAAAAAELAALQAEQEAAAAASAATSNNSSSNSSSGSNYGSSSSSSSSYDNDKVQTVTGNIVVDRAYSQIGKPYVWGACGPSGFDCSGLVSYCLTGSYSRLGTTYTFMNWTRVSNPQPGDICTSWEHCGIYIGGGQMIHAPTEGQNVKIGSVQSGMIYVRY